MQSRRWSYLFSFYRLFLYPALSAFGSVGQQCRFVPSCSHYAEQAFSRFSFFYALRLSLKRVLKCNPWTSADCNDPVPPSGSGTRCF